MPITLAPDHRQQALASIQRFLREELDLDAGDLKAGTVLEYFLEELAPVVYNRAVQDAQRYLQERTLDLEGVCHADEFGWSARLSTRTRCPR
jgi:uncharacterized protein (DUF2164 family)